MYAKSGDASFAAADGAHSRGLLIRAALKHVSGNVQVWRVYSRCWIEGGIFLTEMATMQISLGVNITSLLCSQVLYLHACEDMHNVTSCIFVPIYVFLIIEAGMLLFPAIVVIKVIRNRNGSYSGPEMHHNVEILLTASSKSAFIDE